jgi:hypothetical protein
MLLQQSFWWALGIEWNIDLDIHDMIVNSKTRYAMDFIMEIIITGWVFGNRGMMQYSRTCHQ